MNSGSRKFAFKTKSLSYRMLIYVVLCSSTLTLLTSALQLYIDYRKDLLSIHSDIQFIEDSYLSSIAYNVFSLDEVQIKIQLDGVLKIPNIVYVETRDVHQQLFSSAGSPDVRRDITHSFSLSHTIAPGRELPLGTLTVSASVAKIYNRLWEKAKVILLSNAVKTSLASIVIFFVFQFLITRHLVKISNYAKELNVDNLDNLLALNRKSSRPDEQDELGQLVWSINDMQQRLTEGITENKNSEARMSMALQATKSGAWDWDLVSGGVIYDKNWLALCGYTQEDVEPDIWSWTRQVHPDDMSELQQILNTHLEGNSISFEHEYRLKKKDGSYLWGLDCGKVVERGEDGSPQRMIGTITDISERIKSVDTLRQSEEHLRTTLNSIGDAVIAVDLDDRVTQINPVAQHLTGWTFEEAQGRPLSKIFHIINAKTREDVESPTARVRTSGAIVGLANHTLLIAKNGAESQIADSAAPIMDTDGNVQGVVLVFRDVTEQYEMEENIFKARKLESIGVLAGGIAHDFNNLLTGLFGNIELAKMKLPREHAAYSFIDNANQALDSATSLTKQLLTFAKGGDPLLEAVNIKQVIKKCVEFNLSGSNIKAALNVPDDLWQGKVDRGLISQVVANLTINAKQAMPDGGIMTIDAENISDTQQRSVSHLTGNYIKIRIRDEGVGISNEHIEKVFDPYFTTKQTGSGLGLATVHSIVAKHDGHISVESKLGVGTTFTLYFPADVSAPETTRTIPLPLPLTEKSKSTAGHILIMDDEVIIRELSADMLNALNYTGDTAKDGKEALDKYISANTNGKAFNVVIMDLTIQGGMGGKDAINELLAIDPKAKVIVSSGYATDPIMANYGDYKFKGRLTKPYKVKEMEKELSRVMALEL